MCKCCSMAGQLTLPWWPRWSTVPQFTIGSLAELFDWNPGVVTTSTSQRSQVPGTAECRIWEVAGVTFVRIRTQRQLDHLHTFYTSRPSFVGRLSGRRVTRHSSAASIPTSSSASLSSPLPSPSPLSARPDYGRNNWHRSRGVMGVVL